MAGHGYHWENALAGIMLPVSPSDSADLGKIPTAGIYIGTAGTGGTLVVDDMDGNTATFKNLANGQILPIKIRRVRLTGTSAADVLALY